MTKLMRQKKVCIRFLPFFSIECNLMTCLFRCVEKEKTPNHSDISEKKKTINLVLSILCSASYRLRQLSNNELCKPEVLDTLIKTCRLTYKRHSPEAAWDSYGAPMVLSHIIEAKNFVSLLKTNFIFQVYDMANPVNEHRNCALCSDVSCNFVSIIVFFFIFDYL